ncbi:MAG: sensor histidine kinase [Microbacteriaceae bacterium]
MDSAWLVLAAMAIGAMVGVGFMIMFDIAERRGNYAARIVDPGIPQGVDEMLAAFDTAGMVLDPSNNVLRINDEALELGLLTKKGNLRPEIADFVAAVREADYDFEDDVFLPGEVMPSVPRRLSLHGARVGARYLVVLAMDRTDEDREEAIRRDFIANISHELKTPTASVRLISEAIERAADDPHIVRRFNSRLEQEAERLAHITAEVIELSRLQGGALLSRREPVEVAAVVAEALTEHELLIHDKQLTVAADLPPNLWVLGDADSLRTAAANLVANAIAYSDDHSRIGVGVQSKGGMVEISVTDHGIGMDPAEIDRIFERFYRVDQARSRNTGGTGLGLSIVKHIAHNHGGHVQAWSRPGKGSTFTIRIPELDQTQSKEHA